MATLVHVEVEDEVLRELEALARETGRSVEELQQWALREFVREERELVDAVREGRQQVADGEIVGNDEVVAWLMSYGSENSLPRPEPKVFN